MGLAGYLAVVRKGGTPTTFTNEAFGDDTGSTIANKYVITDSAKAVWQRNTVPSFREGATGSTISSTDIAAIDYLFGKVTFNSTHATVVGSGKYVPLSSIAGAYQYTLTMTADILDDTDFDSTGYRTYLPGINNVTLSLTRWDTLNLEFWNVLENTNATGSSRFVADIQPGGTGPIARGWFVVGNDGRSGDVNSLEQGDVELVLDDRTVSSFRWSDLS